uniref:Uncharacterized protein n=1 Tax=Salarias fasciatus TaxID=181472 RepID=A0A672I181_SALFA
SFYLVVCMFSMCGGGVCADISGVHVGDVCMVSMIRSCVLSSGGLGSVRHVGAVSCLAGVTSSLIDCPVCMLVNCWWWWLKRGGCAAHEVIHLLEHLITFTCTEFVSACSLRSVQCEASGLSAFSFGGMS